MSRTAMSMDDTAMAIDGMGNIVLLNSTHMKVYGRNGDLLREVRHLAQPRDLISRFVSAVVDGAGNVVAVDQAICRIVVISAAGGLVRFFGQHGEGALKDPTDVAVGRVFGAGCVFVSDPGGHRIVVFSAVGVFLYAIDRRVEGKRIYPMRVAVNGAGRVCVADWQLPSPRIVVLSALGGFLRAFTHDYGRNGFAMDMAVDGSGNFYLMDVDNHRIGVFSAAGELIGNMGDKQMEVGEIRSPSRLEVDTAGSRLSAGTLEMRRKLREGVFDVLPNDIFSRGEIPFPSEIPFPRLVVDSAGSVFVRHFDLGRIGRHQHVTLFEQPIRLNEEYEREYERERTVALLMCSHKRLGTPSKLGLLDPELVRTIWEALEHKNDTFRGTFNESASRVRIM